MSSIFELSDGRMMAASMKKSVHFEQDGEWVEIDNRLKEDNTSLFLMTKPQTKTTNKPLLKIRKFRCRAPFEKETNDYAGDGEPSEQSASESNQGYSIRRTISKLNLQKSRVQKNLLT